MLLSCIVIEVNLFPLSAISVELYYIFATVWGREVYTLYGILLVVFFILMSVTACISIALTYFQLSIEDYRWWWRSIFSSGQVLSHTHTHAHTGSQVKVLSLPSLPSGLAEGLCLPMLCSTTISAHTCMGPCRLWSSLATHCWPVTSSSSCLVLFLSLHLYASYATSTVT